MASTNSFVLAIGALFVLPFFGAAPGAAGEIGIGEYAIPEDAMCRLQEKWWAQLVERHGVGAWAPMRMELDDEALGLMGLPPRAVLLDRSFDEPTLVRPDGTTQAVALPALATYGGVGCLGIRPGAWLILITADSIGWCSLAHVYGAPGSYEVSTAGHCGRVGDEATTIAAFSDEGLPVLATFGTFTRSTGDAGIGKDWALISVAARYQPLVSPTMCAWGGPTGMYTKTGATAAFSWPGQIGRLPTITTSTDPLLAQTILHYGHGTALGGPGVGTARVGEAIDWRPGHFTWFGAISPGDSGSGSNVATGDAIGATREAAGINTHIYVDGLRPFQTGTGYLASTRATLVQGTLANGQLLPYPAPVPAAP